MHTYCTHGYTFTVERDRFAPRSSCWIATLGHQRSLDGGVVIATADTEANLKRSIGWYVEREERRAARETATA